MATFTVHFINFGVFVYHNQGLAVILGSKGHTLSYVAGGPERLMPKQSDALLIEVKPDGTKVVGGQGGDKTGLPSGNFMARLDTVMGGSAPISHARVLGTDRSNQNARVQLHGGRLVDESARTEAGSTELADVLWDFSPLGAKAGSSMHRITNRATFVHDIPAGTTYELAFDDGTIVSLGDGVSVTFINRDEEECPPTGPRNEELPELLTAVGIPTLGQTAMLSQDVLDGLHAMWSPNGQLCKPCEHYYTVQDY